MGSSRSLEQCSLIEESDASSSVSLVERGLNCILQGHYAEGAAFFALARGRLFPNQEQLTAALDAVNNSTTSYLYAQQALHDASKRFTESDIEQQAKIAALKKLLPTLIVDTDKASHASVRPRKTFKDHQSLHLLRQPPSEDGNPLPALYITCFGRFEVRRFSAVD